MFHKEGKIILCEMKNDGYRRLSAAIEARTKFSPVHDTITTTLYMPITESPYRVP